MLDFSVLPNPVIYGFVAFLGLVLGSFASMLAYRIPRIHDWFLEEVGEGRKTFNQSLWAALMTRSRCTSCEEKLAPLDLVPVFSWLFSKGVCRHCGAKISACYPLFEIGCALMAVLIFHVLGVSLLSGLLLLSLPFMAASFQVDLEYLILPDEFTLAMGFVGLFYVANAAFFAGFNINPWGDVFSAVLCGLAYGFFGWLIQFGFYKATGKEGLGWGDVKFFIVAGLWVGWWLMPIYLILSSLIGVVIGLSWKLFNKQALFPFGPALILALYLIVLFRDFFDQVF